MSYITVSEELNAYELKERLWSGAEDTMQKIIDAGKEDTFFAIIQDMYCDQDSINITTLNDLLRFDEGTVMEWLGMDDKKEEYITINETDCNCLMVDEDIVDYLRKEVENSNSGVVTTDLYSIEMELNRELTEDEVEELLRVGG